MFLSGVLAPVFSWPCASSLCCPVTLSSLHLDAGDGAAPARAGAPDLARARRRRLCGACARRSVARSCASFLRRPCDAGLGSRARGRRPGVKFSLPDPVRPTHLGCPDPCRSSATVRYARPETSSPRYMRSRSRSLFGRRWWKRGRWRPSPRHQELRRKARLSDRSGHGLRSLSRGISHGLILPVAGVRLIEHRIESILLCTYLLPTTCPRSKKLSDMVR